MTFLTGTSTDYIDMLNQFIQVVTSDHLHTVAIAAGGTGYTVGDVLGITGTGGTATHLAKIEVVTVAGGVITAARVNNGGAYTVAPTTVVANAATGGTGAGATFNLTFAATGWTLTRRNKVAASAVVSAGGTGYGVGNTLTVQGGILGNNGVAATFTVATLSGSAVATLTLASAGQYEVPPSNPAIVTGGAGTGATLTVTYANKTGDTVVMLTGDGGGSNIDPICVIKTYQGTDEGTTNTTYNWALFMTTAASITQPAHQLSNITPGFKSDGSGDMTVSVSGDGAFVPLKTTDAFNMTWWISATGRRIHAVFKVSGPATTFYSSLSMGLLNPLGITSEAPYPAYVMGSSDRVKVWYRDTTTVFSGISVPISRQNGPCFVWSQNNGVWLSTKSASITNNISLTPGYGTTSPHCVIWPIGYTAARVAVDDILWVAATNGTTDFDNAGLSQTSLPLVIYRTPNTGGDLFPLYPLTVIQGNPTTLDYRTFGEIDGVFWFSLGGQLVGAEDRMSQSGTFYKIFNNGNRTDSHMYFCIRED